MLVYIQLYSNIHLYTYIFIAYPFLSTLSNKVLHTPVHSPLTDAIGTIRWDLALCLLLSWLLVFLVLVKGVKSTGKSAFLITTLPCLALLVIMIGGLTMEGASKVGVW